MTFTRIATGDALTVLRQLPSELAHSLVTSPPYWRLRDYEIAGQIGLEAPPEEYLGRLLPIFDEAWRVLRKDGTCWVVIGDKYVGKSLALLPGRFGEAMVARGWLCRNKNIWHKPNVIPASATDRFGVDYEEVFLFVKGPRYYFKQQFVPYKESTRQRMPSRAHPPVRAQRGKVRRGTVQGLPGPGQYGGAGTPRPQELVRAGKVGPLDAPAAGERRGRASARPEGANMRSVWTIPVGRCKEAHFATYPEKLVKIAVLAGCPEDGIVLDPFTGARNHGHRVRTVQSFVPRHRVESRVYQDRRAKDSEIPGANMTFTRIGTGDALAVLRQVGRRMGGQAGSPTTSKGESNKSPHNCQRSLPDGLTARQTIGGVDTDAVAVMKRKTHGLATESPTKAVALPETTTGQVCCPKCGLPICKHLLEDPAFLATKVGKGCTHWNVDDTTMLARSGRSPVLAARSSWTTSRSIAAIVATSCKTCLAQPSS